MGMAAVIDERSPGSYGIHGIAPARECSVYWTEIPDKNLSNLAIHSTKLTGFHPSNPIKSKAPFNLHIFLELV
jgi:hypothetical protein